MWFHVFLGELVKTWTEIFILLLFWSTILWKASSPDLSPLLGDAKFFSERKGRQDKKGVCSEEKFTVSGYNSNLVRLLLLFELRKGPLRLEPCPTDINGNVSKSKSDSQVTLGRGYRMYRWQKEKTLPYSENGSLRNKTWTQEVSQWEDGVLWAFSKEEVGSLVIDGSNKQESCHVGVGEAISEPSY